MPEPTDERIDRLNAEFERRFVDLVDEYFQRRRELGRDDSDVESRKRLRRRLPRFIYPRYGWPFDDYELTYFREKQSELQMMFVSDLAASAKQIMRGFWHTPIIGKLNVSKFVRTISKKIRILWGVWLVIFLFVCTSSMFLHTKQNQSPGNWADNLYVAWIAFTTIGFGDFAPDGAVARVVSIFLGLLGVFTTGIVVTVMWQSALEAAEQGGD